MSGYYKGKEPFGLGAKNHSEGRLEKNHRVVKIILKEVRDMFHMPNLTELLVILLIVFLLFGASKLPEVGRGLGEGIRNFKKALSGETEEEKKVKEVKGEEVNKEKV
jgi:twin arginine-targeting protein translocase, TatA/E family